MATRAAVPALVLAAFAASVRSALGYACLSDVGLGLARNASRKGVALDDTTMRWCPGQIPARWPNSQEALTSIRIFKAWDPAWGQEQREATWANLKDFLSSSGGTILLGTQITCNETEDNMAWNWTKQFMRTLQPQSIMGVAIGNELDQLQFKSTDMVPAGCLTNLWERGYFWLQFQRMVSEVDAMGYAAVPVTSVFTGLGLYGQGALFYENPGVARINTFLVNATRRYGSRFAFTWNLYPYFDPNFVLDAGTRNQCRGAMSVATCWRSGCSVPEAIKQARMKMDQLTKKGGNLLWIGETGWSSAPARTLKIKMRDCNEWSTLSTFRSVYQGFLDWDLSVGGDVRPPDHVFWFSVRDALNFGETEHFGLIATCDDPTCKIKSGNFTAESYVRHMGPTQKYCLDPPVYDSWAVDEITCQNKCTLDSRCNFYSVWPEGYDGMHWCRLTGSCDANVSAPYNITTYRRASAPVPTATPPRAPAPSTTRHPTSASLTPTGGVCFQSLTGRPGEIATTAGTQLSYLTYRSLEDCGKACLGNTACGSFIACPDIGFVCYLHGGAVRAADNHTAALGGCQTYYKATCAVAASGQVGPLPPTTGAAGEAPQKVELSRGARSLTWRSSLAVLVMAVLARQ